jgi:hypothetical protein
VDVNWKLLVIDPVQRALDLCGGSMDEGDGWGHRTRGGGYGDGEGWGYGDGEGDGEGYSEGTGRRNGDGWGDGWGDAKGGGISSEEWL